MSRSLVSSRLTFAAKAGPFVPVAAEGTSETDWLPEEDGFEPSVPLTKRVALFRRSGRCLKEETGEPQRALGAPIPRSQPGDKGDN